LIGYALKKRNPKLKWLADFRDPWSEWGFLDTLNVGVLARKYHKKLESRVLAMADEIITITPFYVKQFEALSNRKVHLLTNGFDEDDFQNLNYSKPDKFTIRHVGTVNEKCDPRPFMNVIHELVTEHEEFGKSIKIEFIGEVHSQFKIDIDNISNLKHCTSFTSSVSHKELILLYGTSSLLLLVLTGYKDAEGYMPGKLFEYIATGLPIMGIGPETGDAADLLKSTNAGKMIDAVNQERIKKALLVEFDKSSNNPIVNKAHSEHFSRRNITEQLTQLL
jgi:glycosyltransferase involved in cell wall biosynthesis